MSQEAPRDSRIIYSFNGEMYRPEFWKGQKPNDGGSLTEYPDYDNSTERFSLRVLTDFSRRSLGRSPLSVFQDGNNIGASLTEGSILRIDELWRMDVHNQERDEISTLVFPSSTWAVVCPASKPSIYGDKVILGFHEKIGVADYKTLPVIGRIFSDRSVPFPHSFTVGDIWRDILAGGREEELRGATRVEIHGIGIPKKATSLTFLVSERLKSFFQPQGAV